MLCTQILDIGNAMTVDGTHDTACGQPATHYLFGHRDAPICGDCIDSYRESSDWTEEELGLVPINHDRRSLKDLRCNGTQSRDQKNADPVGSGGTP